MTQTTIHDPSKPGVALVSGGTGSLGQEVVRALAAAGWTVAFQYNRSEKTARNLTEEVHRARGTAHPFQFAFESGLRSPEAFIKEISDQLGFIRAFIHCCTPVFRLSDYRSNWMDVFNDMVSLNLEMFLGMANACLPPMMFRQDGTVVTILSDAVRPDRIPQFSAYAAAKLAQASLVKDLSESVEGAGVRVAGLLPGAFVQDQGKEKNELPGPVINAIRSRWPVGLPPVRLAHVIEKAIRPDSDLQNGQFLSIDAMGGKLDVTLSGFFAGEAKDPSPSVSPEQAHALAPDTESNDALRSDLKEVFQEALELNGKEDLEDVRLGIGAWDSLQHLDLLMSIEHKLNVDFGDISGDSLTSFLDILAAVRRLKAESR